MEDCITERNDMKEDKQKILDALLPVLQMTSYWEEIKGLKYDTTTEPRAYMEEVIVYYRNDYQKEINVGGDSASAMIKDVINGI